MVPTSAITGDGMGDLMAMMVLVSQKFLNHQLMWSAEVEATVMEVQIVFVSTIKGFYTSLLRTPLHTVEPR